MKVLLQLKTSNFPCVLQQRSWAGRQEEAGCDAGHRWPGISPRVWLQAAGGLPQKAQSPEAAVCASAWPFVAKSSHLSEFLPVLWGDLKELLWARNVRFKFRNVSCKLDGSNGFSFYHQKSELTTGPGALQGPERLVIPFLTRDSITWEWAKQSVVSCVPTTCLVHC